MCLAESDLDPCRIEALKLATGPVFFKLVESFEELRSMTSLWLGAVRRKG